MQDVACVEKRFTIGDSMESLARHQCLIYQGAPSRHLPAVAAVASQKLRQHYRCVYLNSEPMVAGMRSYLAAAGVDVAHEVKKGSLVLTSERRQLVGGPLAGPLPAAVLRAAAQPAPGPAGRPMHGHRRG